MVVDGFEVFDLHPPLWGSLIAIQAGGDLSYEVLDKTRIVVRLLRHELLVGALEDPVQLC